MLIGIPVYEGFDLLDVTGPWEMFHWAKQDKRAADLCVQLVAEVPGAVACNGGLTINVKAGLADAPQFDVIWTPGGAPDALHRLMYGAKRPYLDFLARQAAGAKWVCSVCEGALLLAQAGLLDGYTVTTHWAFVPCFLDRFPKVVIADGFPRYVQDRNRLTGGGISSGLDESLQLIRLLYGEAVAEGVQQNTQYYPDPPVSSQIPQTNYCPVPAPPAA
jgi:transcriptional regulator GlxA family with amidase domain